MAVPINNLTNLISRDNPYVHSNVTNFADIAWEKLLVANKGEDGQLKRTITTLEKVRDGLKGQTDAFLGGLTPSQFIKQYYFGGGDGGEITKKYYQGFTKFFQSSGFYYKISNSIGYSTSGLNQNVAKAFEKESDKIIPLGVAAKNIMEKFTTVSNRPQKNESGRIKYTIHKKELKDIVDKELYDLFNQRKKPAYTRLKKEVKEILKKRNNNTKSSNVYAMTAEILNSNDCKEFIKSYVGNDDFDDNTYIQYRDSLKHYLEKFLGNRTISQQSELSGMIGEEFEIAMLSSLSGEQGFRGEFVLTGSKTEDVTKKIIQNLYKKVEDYGKFPDNPVKNSWNDSTKAGQTDFVMYSPKSKRYARVQAKNYQEIVAKFKPNEQNMTQHIRMFDKDKTISQFITDLENMGQMLGEKGGNPFAVADPAGIAYVIANSLWFSYAGSINRKEEIKTVEINNKIIFRELGLAVGNFLGIIVNENIEPIGEFSNLFFLINNEILLPTWVIIDELIKMIEKSKIQSTLSQFSMTKGNNGSYVFLNKSDSVPITAKGLRQKKEETVKEEGGFMHQGTYTNPNLVAVGRETGKAIIKSNRIRMRNISLNIDYEKAIKSAYNLF